MWLSPNSLQRRTIRFQESTSVGGKPVSGKMQHSNVPRKSRGVTVDQELTAVGRDLPHAKRHCRVDPTTSPVDHVLVQRHLQLAEMWFMFTPQLDIVARVAGSWCAAATSLPRRRSCLATAKGISS